MSIQHWRDPNWLQKVHAWMRAEAACQSLNITSEIEQPHAYPWSTVLYAETNEGRIFFKATATETTYEAALTQKLTAWFPDCMPDLIAVDTDRGWMLMRDGGEQLRASIRPTKNIAPWEPVIARYAELQIGLTGHLSEILALGIPDHRPRILPALYSQLLDDTTSLMIDQPRGLTSSEYQQLRGLENRFAQICNDLMSFGIPDSLNHGDFHDGNILLKNRRITFFDWGDAAVTHPFVSLRTLFVSIEIALQLDDYSFTPEMSKLLDLYLEPWQKFGSKDALLSVYRFSKPVAAISKALAWHQTISRLTGTEREEYAWIVPEVLREFMVYEKMLKT